MPGATTALAALAAAATGPLVDYHPACLRAALLLGQPGVATAALRALMHALSTDDDTVTCFPTGSRFCTEPAVDDQAGIT